MEFALVIMGLVMIVSGARDTYDDLGTQLIKDFTGEGNFVYWLVALGAIGALGAWKPLQGFSRAFMALIILGMLLANQSKTGGGFFEKLTAALGLPKGTDDSALKLVGSSSTSDVWAAGNSLLPGLPSL